MKKVQQYGSGQAIPDGAQYLTTVIQQMGSGIAAIHFFLVEDKKEEGKEK
jgi:hypothetical protein